MTGFVALVYAQVSHVTSTCRMSRLEESYKRKVDDITHESAQRAAEKEKQLQTEVQM